MPDIALLGIDVGTSSCKAIALAGDGRELGRGKVEYQQSYLDCGWVANSTRRPSGPR